MPNVTPPATPYTLPEWEAQPKNPTGEKEFEKYDYISGETLASIAQRISQPGRPVTGDEIANFNWGTAGVPEINFYLRDHNGAKPDPTDINYVLGSDDRQPWLWVPKVVPPAPIGKFRSPGKHDVGHVAPDHEPALHINTLVVPPVYSITLELGDIDAIFDPMDPRTDAAAPWANKGVQQRLQVLGYLYTPLGHSGVKDPPHKHAEKCWNYYKMVHDRKRGGLVIYNRPVASQTAATVEVRASTLILTVTGGANAGTSSLVLTDADKRTLTQLALAINGLGKGWVAQTARDGGAASANLVQAPAKDGHGEANQQTLATSSLSNAELLGTLKQEVQNHIITRSFPKSGSLFQNSQLPRPKDLAVIRFPGAYCLTWPRVGWKDIWEETTTGRRETRAAPPARRATDPDAKYDFALFDDMYKIEAALVGDNELLGKIPLVARVHELLPDGSVEPAEGVSVYFQLAPPDAFPVDSPFQAPGLRNEAMDYGKDWDAWEAATKTPPMGTAPADWDRAKALVPDVMKKPEPDRDPYIAGLSETNEVKDSLRALLAKKFRNNPVTPHAPPYTVSGGGPAKFLKDTLDAAKTEAEVGDVNDPQKWNAPAKYGGKTGLPVAKNIFEVGKQRPGLHTRRSAQHRDYGNLSAAEEAKPDGDLHKYAVQARTNDKGYAGVMFMPSGCGGDRYRIRAYVGPESLQFPASADFSGEDAKGPVVETGTLVVWRNIRIFRYLQKGSIPIAALSPTVKEMLEWPAANSGTKYRGKKNWTDSYKAMSMTSGVVTINFGPGWTAESTYARTKRNNNKKRMYRPVDVDFINVAKAFNQCYCELIMDTDRPEPIPEAMLRQALVEGRSAASASGEITKRVDWDTLVFHDPQSPFLFNVRHWTHYNKLITDAGTIHTQFDELAETDEDKIKNSITPAFMTDATMQVFADGGVYPGLTLVQVAFGDTWSDHCLQGEGMFPSGIATAVRGAYIFYTEATHRGDSFGYSATSNAVHELGHCLLGEHQDTFPGGDPYKHQPQPADAFMTPTLDDVPCIMGYQGCYGEFCGRCVLRMRGWISKSWQTPAGA